MRLVSTGHAGRAADEAERDVSTNGLRIIGASGLQNVGDQVVNAATVLPWLLTALGAPVGLIGLLVPIRESGSLLPQAVLSPWIQRWSRRKWVWVAGAAVQATATVAMALVAATLEGIGAGVAILVALALFALGRALTSIASKDVMARTIPKGQRGQINGVSTLVSGVAAVTIGLGIRLLAGDQMNVAILAFLLGGAALAWVAALLVYAGVKEPTGGTAETDADDEGWWRRSWQLLATDAPFRRFVQMRTLLLVSALSPPFLIALAAADGEARLSGLGLFVIAQGAARMIGGRFFGRLADRSSRRLMTLGALMASLSIIVLLALSIVPGLGESVWLYSLGYFLLALVHTGVRVARKTYVIDMGEGDQVTEYVAVSNTAMGLLLLVVGAVNAGLAVFGAEVALAFLAGMGLIGAFVGRSLPEVGGRA
ncbi:MAG: MFS transporter [Trueperaceae bacterium]|nr:MFS transporter [Trueperaceae bacterium]